MLKRHRHAAVVVAPAIRHHQEHRIVPIFLVRLHRLINLTDAFVDDRNGPRVEIRIAPVDVIGILVVDHHQPRPQLPKRSQRQCRQHAVAARIHQAGLSVIFLPMFPKPIQLRAGHARVLDSVVLGFHFLELLHFGQSLLVRQRRFLQLLTQQIRLEPI